MTYKQNNYYPNKIFKSINLFNDFSKYSKENFIKFVAEIRISKFFQGYVNRIQQ